MFAVNLVHRDLYALAPDCFSKHRNSNLLSKCSHKFDMFVINPMYPTQIWKEKHKELYVLFTNWGRIGDFGGQYQVRVLCLLFSTTLYHNSLPLDEREQPMTTVITE